MVLDCAVTDFGAQQKDRDRDIRKQKQPNVP